MAHNVAVIRKGLAAGLIPDTVLKQIDDQEVLDRLAYAGELTQKANAVSGTERRDLIRQARAVMQAQPRAITERAVRETVAKASALGNGHQADALTRHANELLEQHPPAPRREGKTGVAKAALPVVVYSRAGRMCSVDPARIGQQIAKAGSGDGDAKMVAVYDAAGNLVGVADPEDITPLQSAGAPAANKASPAQPAAAAPAGGQSEVAKARRTVPVPARAVFDAAKNMIGIVRGTEFKPVPPAARPGHR